MQYGWTYITFADFKYLKKNRYLMFPCKQEFSLHLDHTVLIYTNLKQEQKLSVRT